ncbi:PREDICTED: G2/M phase-specific E3 ubiquitin-protein ligase-like [Amphimedon queenslandica]|uniref:HECT domain-containing protein n=1 Tax=Amphimedon queenslandica TaxID=400682 RepID=A0AAN0JKW3_AMPQE|nr:PREDICTED: G2/M phase-specific E3 ubiquitin-protein ligase-like [Amphimedon queenslandica]|eukprot:XP_019857667.1 PREDICTED: G2/M phase-specific E3 ubiquitin-protein ligase-like [Amphimedon queenslandica]
MFVCFSGKNDLDEFDEEASIKCQEEGTREVIHLSSGEDTPKDNPSYSPNFLSDNLDYSPIPLSYDVYAPIAPPYSPIPHNFESHVSDASSSPDLPPVTFLNNSGRSKEKEEVTDLKSCIKQLQSINKTLTAPHLYLEFRRDFILTDALKHSTKPKFDPKNQLKVTFVGEAGEDIGGLRREFWRLFVSSAAQEYFIGEASCKTFQPNVQALQDEVYERLGEWIAMSVVQDGFGFPMLAPSIYEYMVTGTCTCTNIPVQDIPEPRVSSLVLMICSAETVEELKSIFDDDTYANALFETGYKKPISSLTLHNKEELTNVISTYHTLIKVKAQIDQFVKGLESLNIHSYMVKFPAIMKTLFVKENEKLTAEYVKGLIKVKFSDKESLLRQKEEATYMHFVDFLDECEEGSIDVTLDDVLIFLTGSDREPPLGFSRTPEVTFLHDASRTMALASTCTLELKLPTCHNEYSSFCSSMKWSFKGHGGFHVV